MLAGTLRIVLSAISSGSHPGSTASPAPLPSLFHYLLGLRDLLSVGLVLSPLLFLALSIEYLVLHVGVTFFLLPLSLVVDLPCKLRVHSCSRPLDIKVSEDLLGLLKYQLFNLEVVEHHSLSLPLGRYVHDLIYNDLELLLLVLVDGLVLELRIEVLQVLVPGHHLLEVVQEDEYVEARKDDGLVKLDQVSELAILILLANVLALSQGVLAIVLAFLEVCVLRDDSFTLFA